MSVCADPLPIVVVDNYDSFTHNIVHALALAGACCEVVKNDEVPPAALVARRPAGFVISAGPCTPSEAGLSLELVRTLLRSERPPPLLGICLGHQTIAAALGARIVQAKQARHGKVARVHHDGRGVLAGLPQPLQPSGWDEDGDLMALRHRDRPMEGVQFHPESILSDDCAPLFDAWLAQCATAACDEGAARAG